MDYRSFTVKKLQQLCKKEGLPGKGSKQELVEALERVNQTTTAADATAAPIAEIPKEIPVIVEPVIEEAPSPVIVGTTKPAAPAVKQTMKVAAVAPVLRTSSRAIKPRTCTMCVGCNHNKSSNVSAVDEVSIGELAEKFATVKIVPSAQPSGEVPELQKSEISAKAVKASKPRTAARPPLKVKSVETLNEIVAVVEEKIEIKPTKAKSTNKKTASLNDIAAGNGKENLPASIEAAVTARPSRKPRVGKT